MDCPPMSRSCFTSTGSFQAARTTGATPCRAMLLIWLATSPRSLGECSVSMTSQSNPHSASNSLTWGLANVANSPTCWRLPSACLKPFPRRSVLVGSLSVDTLSLPDLRLLDSRGKVRQHLYGFNLDGLSLC